MLPRNHFEDKPILKDKKTHGDVLGNLGIAYSDLGELRKAIEYYEQALKISKEIGDRRREEVRPWKSGKRIQYSGRAKKSNRIL